MDTPSAPSAPSSATSTPNSTPTAPKTTAPSGASSSAAPAPKAGTASATSTPHGATSIPTDAPVKGEATQTQAAKVEAAKRKYKLKVDGAEQELELGDDEIAVRLQKAVAAEKRMQEAAEDKKRAKSMLDVVSDPLKLISHPELGPKILEAAERKLIEQFQAEELKKNDPAAAERAELQRQLEEYKRKEAEAQESQQAKQRQELEDQVYQQTEREFLDALDTSNLPKNRQTLYMMAEVARLNLDHGIEMTPQQMASEVNERLRGMHQHVMSGLKGDQLASYLGDEIVNEVLKHSVEKLRAKKNGAQPKLINPEAAEAPTQQPALDDDEPFSRRRTSADLREWKKLTRG